MVIKNKYGLVLNQRKLKNIFNLKGERKMVYDDIIRNEVVIKCAEMFTPARPKGPGKKDAGLPFFFTDAPPGQFQSFSLDDKWMYLVKNNQPSLDYDVFQNNGFKIKGIVLKDRRVNLVEILTALGGYVGTYQHKEEFYSTTKLTNGSPGRASSSRSLTDFLTFPYLPFVINSAEDIKNHQNAFIEITDTFAIREENKWLQLAVLICEHISTGREVVHQMAPQKGYHDHESADMYITYLETADGRIRRIDNYREDQLEFLYPPESDIYNGVCDKEAIPEVAEKIAFRCRDRR